MALLDTRNNFGRTFTLTRANQNEDLLSVSDPDPEGRIWTILLRYDVTNPSVPLRARLNFGNAGFRSETYVDFLNGCAFSIAAGSIRVTVIGPAFPLPGFSATVGAYIVSGIGIQEPLPTLNLAGLMILPGATGVLPEMPPNFSRLFRVETFTPQVDSFEIQILEASGAAYTTFVPAGTRMDWIYLPAGIVSIQIVNVGPNPLWCFPVAAVKLC